MTNLEMLVFGIQHIAENHGFRASVDYENDGEVAICGGMGFQHKSVPTLADVRMLCEDVKIPYDFIETTLFGVDVYLPTDWMEKTANKKYKGCDLWRKVV